MEKQVIYSTEPEDFYYTAVNVPCQAACPAATNIPAYIRALYEDNYARSYEINRLANLLPGVLGRVCSRPCEDKCRHGEAELGHPVKICHIKRAAADLKQRVSNAEEGLFASLGKKVAVVGSGPAGLAAAHDLSTLGFSVTVFEALDKAGGMLRYGIPEFRLPREVLDEEIGRIIQTGASLRTGVRIGEDVAVGEFLAEFDAVLIAAGCYKPIPLNVPG
ncbi:MAG: FAD-dependent oxidoreductase, partial [Desulfatiglandales bacterium]